MDRKKKGIREWERELRHKSKERQRQASPALALSHFLPYSNVRKKRKSRHEKGKKNRGNIKMKRTRKRHPLPPLPPLIFHCHFLCSSFFPSLWNSSKPLMSVNMHGKGRVERQGDTATDTGKKKTQGHCPQPAKIQRERRVQRGDFEKRLRFTRKSTEKI
jgi:hypothetical protein